MEQRISRNCIFGAGEGGTTQTLQGRSSEDAPEDTSNLEVDGTVSTLLWWVGRSGGTFSSVRKGLLTSLRTKPVFVLGAQPILAACTAVRHLGWVDSTGGATWRAQHKFRLLTCQLRIYIT